MNRPQLFIEKIMPVKLLNQQVYYEHGGNPFKGLHRWYSRKPLSFSRATVLASILPADLTMEQFLYIMGIYGQDDVDFWDQSDLSEDEKDPLRNNKEIRLYKQPPTDRQIAKMEEICQQVWGTTKPSILDAFAGGGSIPFEATRYGLNVFASDLNPVAVMTMKAAMEYPLKFGKSLQKEIDKWVNFVGKEAEKRLADFFPSSNNETVQNYLWAHTVTCPNCQSMIPLSPNWWVDRSPGAIKKGQICAVKPIPNLLEKRVNFELIKGHKGKGNTIKTDSEEYDPDAFSTIGRGVGKCCNCGNIIENDYIASPSQENKLGHQLYAVAYKKGKGSLEFRTPTEIDLLGIEKAQKYVEEKWIEWEINNLISYEATPTNQQYSMIRNYGITQWHQCFNPRQLLTLVTYVEIINSAKEKILAEYDLEKAQAIITYLALVISRCADFNSRLTCQKEVMTHIRGASATHALNLMWNYLETNGANFLFNLCADAVTKDYTKLCEYFNKKSLEKNSKNKANVEQASSLLDLLNNNENHRQDACATDINIETNIININLESADSLYHIPDKSLEAIVTDPPYYGTIPYADISDFFYCWMRRVLGDIFPEIFWQELTDKEREAVANPSRFRNMGESPDELAKRDYEAKMSMAWNEAYRVLKDEGVLTVQFNHKEAGAWDTLAKALIDAGFEITASWAVSTENPQNLHQAKKNSVSSTVILVCRKRDLNAPQAWWDDLRPEVSNLVEARASYFEDNDITGIDLYLSAFGVALNVFSKSYPILDSVGDEVRPEVAFAEARKAIASYRFRKLVQTDTIGFDPLTQWYLLAWDAFGAREFPFDEARQLALAIGGFNVNDLVKEYKLIESKSGNCTILEPRQRLKRRAFTTDVKSFSASYLIDGLHAVIAVYEEEKTLEAVHQFIQKTGLVSNDLFMKAIEVAFKVIPDNVKEKETLVDLWLRIDEIKERVSYKQGSLF